MDMTYYIAAFCLYISIMFFVGTIYLIESDMNKFNWKKLLLDVIKVIVGGLAGWLTAGSV